MVLDINVDMVERKGVLAIGKLIGYVRVSTARQDADNQRHEILEYANRHHLHVDEFIEIEISSRKDKKQRRIEELMSKLRPGDIIIVSELSRLGRSTSEVIDIVNGFIAREVKFIAIKQGIIISGQHDMQSKVIVTMFSLFAELERDIISQRTRTALAAKKASGKKLGKPEGTIQKSMLDQHQDQIKEFLRHGVSKSAIARMLGTSRSNLINYIKTRRLVPPKSRNPVSNMKGR